MKLKLQETLKSGDLVMIEEFLKQNPDVAKATFDKDSLKVNALTLAVSNVPASDQRINVFKLLVTKGADTRFIETRLEDPNVAYNAVSYPKTLSIEELDFPLDAGADPNFGVCVPKEPSLLMLCQMYFKEKRVNAIKHNQENAIARINVFMKYGGNPANQTGIATPIEVNGSRIQSQTIQHPMKIRLPLRNPKLLTSATLFRCLQVASAVFLSTVNPASAAPAAETFVGTWTGSGKLMIRGDCQVKLTLNVDKTCLMEYSNNEPTHGFNPYPSTQNITVTGSWRIESGQPEDHVKIDGKITKWTQLIVDGEWRSTINIKPKPLDEDFYFAIQPDGTLKRALLKFDGEGIPGLPFRALGIGVNLTKQNAR